MKYTEIVNNSNQSDGDLRRLAIVDGFSNDLQIQIEAEGSDHYIDLWKDEVVKLRDRLNEWIKEKGGE